MSLKNDIIKLTSKDSTGFNSDIVVEGEKYFVQTEYGGTKIPSITTRIFLKGTILSTRKTEYKDILGLPDSDRKVQEFMQKQHKFTIQMLKEGKKKKIKTPSDYLEDVKTLIKRKDPEKAITLLKNGLEQYPDNSVLLSYYGCLESILNKNYKFGISTCKRAIENLKKKVRVGEEFFYPVFYLNLGRAYLAAGKRKDAHESFLRGIELDAENPDLLDELRRLGKRRSPAVPFLKRSHPVNKYIGMLLHKYTK